MKRILTILSALLAAYLHASAGLNEEIAAYTADIDARVGVAAIIEGRDTVCVDGRGMYPMMSVMKFPQALAVASWLDEHSLCTSDYIDISAAALHEDTYSPMLKLYGRRDLRLTYGELLRWSLAQSDNNACDILFDAVGGVDSVMRHLDSLGLTADLSIAATETDMYADRQKSYLNISTAIALAALMGRYDTDLRRRSQNFAAIGPIIEQCATGTDRLAAPLSLSGAVIGHKTGTGFVLPSGRLMAVNDCGYVHIPDGRRYTIAVMVADSGLDLAATSAIIADISAMVYREVIAGQRETPAM